MNDEYMILQEGRCVGRARIERQGMYYLIRCRCKTEMNEKLRIYLRAGTKERDLGLCVPMDGEMGLDTRVPVKAFSDEDVSFRICHGNPGQRGNFLPVRENGPFEALDRLMEARFVLRDGIPGVLLKD